MMIILEQLLNWFLSIGARPIDLLFIAILYFVRLKDIKRIEKLMVWYQLLNTGLATHGWIIKLKLGVTTIRRHRNGDIELVDAINEIDGDQ